MAVRVRAAGLVTSVGSNFDTSCAAVRAGIRNVTTANIFDRRSGAFIDAGQVALRQWWESSAVIPDLLAPALQECFESPGALPPSEIPIFLGLPGGDRKGRPEGLDAAILTAAAERLNFRLHPSSRVVFGSQVSGCFALREVRQLLDTRAIHSCIVAGVDSLVRTSTVQAYLDDSRILTPEHSNGFSPGEASAAVLLDATRGESGLEIIGLGFARESATVDSEEPFRADGLTEAVRVALEEAAVSMADVSYRITDVNGERYKFKEATFTFGRLLKKRVTNSIDLWHPIEYVGEVGAAIGPLALAIALHAGQHGYAPGDVVLLHFGNDGGDRGAIVARFMASE
jgi:3-oxoacyl-[acyl-carrier-protein] synthase-1